MRNEEELLGAAWDAYEAGELEDALACCARLPQSNLERWLLEASIRTATGEFELAEAALARAVSEGATDHDRRWPMARGELALQRWRLDDAEREFRALLARARRADACSGLAVVRELQGDLDEADRLFAEASRLEPDVYPPALRIDADEFAAVVDEAILDLPPEFQALLEESEVVVAPAPTLELVVPGAEAETPPELLGLFCGASRLDRSAELPGEEPSVIFLFQRNLERACGDLDELRDQIRITLYHELGHLLGFDEDGVHELGLG